MCTAVRKTKRSRKLGSKLPMSWLREGDALKRIVQCIESPRWPRYLFQPLLLNYVPRSIIIAFDGGDRLQACSDPRIASILNSSSDAAFHSLSCRSALFVPDSMSPSVVIRCLSLAPVCHCFKPRGTPRHDVKFKCLSLGLAFRAFLKRVKWKKPTIYQ